MFLTSVAPRPLFHDHGGFLCVLSRVNLRNWFGMVGVGVGAVLLTTAAHGAPNPLWPPNTTLSSSELASSDYWPSDDAYGYGYVSSNGYGDSPGQWWLYSFVPERAANAGVLQHRKLAAGLSVDAAWRYTQGIPEITLAVLDDGLNWCDPDLVDAIFLNVGELGQTTLTHADGTPCAPLTGTDSPRVDCVADHVLSIADFRETLGWVNGATGKDPNQNGLLDPEDLLLLGYADGIDNDGNGFIDDIAGWDFVDFDNRPIDVKTTAGTEAALDALARTNNDVGRAGVCPQCRALPVRVGYERGASPQTLALGLLYASAMGTSAALVGHLPEGRTRVLDAALRNSAQRNMLTLLPRDGEQQRTPTIRFNSDATRIIGTVTQLSGSTMTTGSFVALDPCQTFDSGPTVMAAGPVCSRRGPAVALGIAGLTASRADSNGATGTRLSAFELGAILEHTADAINVGSSNQLAPTGAEGPELRRLNANNAVLSVSEQLIPAEIDLESPRHYDTIARDSLSLPSLPIVGRISALHATTFDLFVELAKGPPTASAGFTVVQERKGLPANVPLVSGSTLATVDLRTWYNNLVSTSVLTEGSDAIATLRVRVVAHFAATTSRTATELESEVQRQLIIVSDQTLLPGFPYKLEASPTPPKLADLNGDGASEIVVGTLDGRLLALNATENAPIDSFEPTVLTRLLPNYQKLRGNSTPSLPSTTPPIFAGQSPISVDLGTEPIIGPASIADLNGDGKLELVFAGKTGRIYALAHNGTVLDGWPLCLPSHDGNDCDATGNAHELESSPVLADIDGDGRHEIVIAANDGYVHALEIDGTTVEGWPIYIPFNEGSIGSTFTSSPAVADMDGDQIDDLVLNTSEPRDPERVDGSRFITVLGAAPPAAPVIASNWPVTVTSYDFRVDQQRRQSPPAAIDAEPQAPRALLYGNATIPFFVPIETGGVATSSEIPRHAEPEQDDGTKGFSLVDYGPDSLVSGVQLLAPLFARPTLADLDRDGTTDVVLPVTTVGTLDALRNTTTNEHVAYLAFWSGKTGKMLPGSPALLDDLVGTATPAIADLTNDGYPEMIITSGSGTIVAFDACGRSPRGWPKTVGGPVTHSPAVGDVDGDNLLEVVVATDDGRVFAWKTEANAKSYVPWESAGHDNMNQSAHRFPGGTIPSSPGPLPLTSAGHCISREPVQPTPNTTEKLSARGGCSCEITTGSTRAPFRLALYLFALCFGYCVRRTVRRPENRARRSVVTKNRPPVAYYEKTRPVTNKTY